MKRQETRQGCVHGEGGTLGRRLQGQCQRRGWGAGGAFKGRGRRRGPREVSRRRRGLSGKGGRGRGPREGSRRRRGPSGEEVEGGARRREAKRRGTLGDPEGGGASGGSREAAKTLGVRGPRQPGHLVLACRPPVLCHLSPHTLSLPLLPG